MPSTTVERQVTGLEMLNLPGEPCGDWRGHGVWLSRNFADDMGRRLCVAGISRRARLMVGSNDANSLLRQALRQANASQAENPDEKSLLED